MNFKEKFNVPDENYQLKASILRTDGYFVCERSKTNHCNYTSKNNIRNPQTESEFTEKYVVGMVIYPDGSFYYPKNVIFNGFERNDMNYYNYCNLLNEQNNYEYSIKKLEKHLSDSQLESNPRYQEGIYEKGIYRISDNKKMILQSYQGWPTSEYTIEEEALIINDSSFVVKSSKIYERNEIKITNDTFRLKTFKDIPNPICYILDNRSEFGN